MTMFAEPDTIACPCCNHYHRRQILCSFNTMWQSLYSDGGTADGVQDIAFNEARCLGCSQIMTQVQQIPALDIKGSRPFWQRWFKPAAKTPYLARPEPDVYFELFQQTENAEEKMQYALQGYRLFNRTYRLQGQANTATQEQEAQHTLVANFILHAPPEAQTPEHRLLQADILRQRGEFDQAAEIYNANKEPKYQHTVEQAIEWCNAKLTCLMAVKQESKIESENENKGAKIALVPGMKWRGLH